MCKRAVSTDLFVWPRIFVTHLAGLIFSIFGSDVVIAWFAASFRFASATQILVEYSRTLVLSGALRSILFSFVNLILGFSSLLGSVFFSPRSALIRLLTHLLTLTYSGKKGFKGIAHARRLLSSLFWTAGALGVQIPRWLGGARASFNVVEAGWKFHTGPLLAQTPSYSVKLELRFSRIRNV